MRRSNGVGSTGETSRQSRTRSENPPDSSYLLKRAAMMIAGLAGGSLPNWSDVQEAAEIRSLEANSVLYGEGDQHDFLYIIGDGLLKVSSVQGGKVRVYGFVRSDDLVAPKPVLPTTWAQLLVDNNRPANPLTADVVGGSAGHTLTTITPATVVALPYGPILQLVEAHPEWMRVVITMSAYKLAARSARIEGLLFLSPEERYRGLLSQEPDVLRAAPQRDIASLLGVSPEAFSRLTSRLRERERERAQATQVN